MASTPLVFARELPVPANALVYQRRPQPASNPDARALALYDDGERHRQAGRLDAAIAAFDAALKLRPAFPEALRAGGGILRDLGHVEAALRFLAEAIRLRPNYLEAVLDHGNLLYATQRFDESAATFDAALATTPGDARLLTNRGIALHAGGRLAEARASLEAALTADARLPQAHLNYGNVLARQGDHADALPAYDRALTLQPMYPAAHVGRGLALVAIGRFDDGAAAFDAAFALEPENAYALNNRGKLHLLRGDYARGLADYEYRLKTEWQDLPALRQQVPAWSGQDLFGLRIVAFADQGSGDVIHFARYVPMLIAAGADVTVLCRPRLQRLLRDVLGGARVVASIGEEDGFDLQIPFGSLPYVFATRVETMPAGEPYVQAEPDRIAQWAARLGGGGFRIGLCWRGNQDWRADPHRSIPVAAFAPLAALPGVRLISLQMDDSGGSRTWPLETYDDVDTGRDAFVDTAAIMANLDLVVTCDTSICHLAGALGAPTFVLLQSVPEWRWMLNRSDTPWYPTMRLFRQRRRGDWQEPIADVIEAVAEMMRARVKDTPCAAWP